MKYDFNKQPMTASASRTLDSFKESMFQLLQSNEFEKISVQLLCKRSGYPRATFYNYFDDKFDLLEYCWSTLFESLSFDIHKTLTPSDALHYYFKKTYELFDKNRELISNMKQFNLMSGYLWSNFTIYTKHYFINLLNDCENFPKISIDLTLIAEHYVNSIFLFLDFIFLQNKQLSYQEAIKQLEFFLYPFINASVLDHSEE
ncbi:MAG: TetR/AcrR family transcriptional regulator [Streptococcus sp.]|nr:TetR/AcrR family transcriptional regulator [Streptococcus sp.]